MKTKIFRYQGTPKMEKHPSWHLYGRARPLEPADADGWGGYWWAEVEFDAISVTGELMTYTSDELYLVRAQDVERARAGEEVDLFVPGLFGCTDPLALLNYIESNAGGVDDDMFVVIYEGVLLHDYDVADESAFVFQPVRVVRVYDARRWVETVKQAL